MPRPIVPQVLALLTLLCALAIGCADRSLEVEGSSSAGLVFARVVGEGVDLARVRLDDGSVVALTRTPDRDEAWPYWSGLARRVVFQGGPIDGRAPGDLWLWQPKTGAETRLTDTPRRREQWAVWSPNQTRLAFSFVGGRAGAGVAVVDPSRPGGQLMVRGGPKQAYLRPTFAPDGRRLVAQRRGDDGRGSNLYLLDDSGTPVQLTFDTGWYDIKAWFSRDGERIVYSRRPLAGGYHEIMNIAADGSDPRAIIRDADSDNHSARPSPVRDELAFVSDRTGAFDVYLASLDGENVRNLSQSANRHEFAPRWSPDGQRLVVTVTAETAGLPTLGSLASLRESRILVYDREGNVELDIPGFMPDWMPPW